MVVMAAFPKAGKNMTDSFAGASMSVASFPCPICQGGREAVPRQGLFLLCTWVPLRERLLQVSLFSA